jgi:hypothetical protein
MNHRIFGASIFLLATLGLGAAPAAAQTLKSLKAEPASARPGEPVTVTLQLELGENPNCGMHVHFGDGKSETAKVNQAKDATISMIHVYEKPGNYKVMAEPKRVGVALKCGGKNATATVAVAAPVPVAAVAASAAAGRKSGPSCPEGWKLAAKSVNKKTGAYQCNAKAGTAAPAARLECPGKLGYYENTKKGQLGCRP